MFILKVYIYYLYIIGLSCGSFSSNYMIFPLSLIGDVEGKCNSSYEYEETGKPPKLSCTTNGWSNGKKCVHNRIY